MTTPSFVLDEKSVLQDSGLEFESPRGLARTLRDYYELTKPNITSLVVLSAAAGYCMGTPGNLNFVGLFHATVAIALLCSGLGALNQYMERHLDGRMRRTEHRPLPMRKIQPAYALLFGVELSIAAEIYLALMLNPLAAILGLFTLVTYLFVYTPLKTRTPWCTFLGAFPGAMPPLVGWVAARGRLGIEGWVLFGILFLWQFPHFHSIAMLYREDYSRAGIRMLPVVEPDNRSTSRQIVLYTSVLFPVSLLPVFFKMAGSLYLLGAVSLGLSFLYFAIRCAYSKTKVQARSLLLASVLYLPLLFALMVMNQIG